MHPHLSKIREVIQSYREGKIDFARLQLSLASVESAIEGDMQNAENIRVALRSAENSIERAWFTLNEIEAKSEILHILKQLEEYVFDTSLDS